MSLTDPIADMLTRIRNGLKAGHITVTVQSSSLKKEMLQKLVEEGFIEGFNPVKNGNIESIEIMLKYHEEDSPVIQGIERVSKPSRRIYVGSREVPRVMNGLGVAILSTSRGILTDRECREKNVGGEVLCYLW